MPKKPKSKPVGAGPIDLDAEGEAVDKLTADAPMGASVVPGLTLAEIVAGGEWSGNEMIVYPALLVDAELEVELDGLGMVHVRTSPGVVTVLRRRG